MPSPPPPPPSSSPSKPTSPTTFATTQLHLLALEAAADATSTSSYLSTYPPRALASAGLALLHLVVCGRKTGMGGRTVLEFERDGAVGGYAGRGNGTGKGGKEDGGGEGAGFEESGIRVGDVVGVREMGAGGGGKKDKGGGSAKGEAREVQGVVLKVTARVVGVALEREEQEGELEGIVAGRVWLCVCGTLSFTLQRPCRRRRRDALRPDGLPAAGGTRELRRCCVGSKLMVSRCGGR